MLVSILTSYSHIGRPREAWDFLQKIARVNKEIVDIRSYNTIVDAFARRGEFNSALEMIKYTRECGIDPNFITWMSILSPCRHYAELEIAIQAFNEINALYKKLKLQNLAAAYVLMGDVYKACGNLTASEELRKEYSKSEWIS